MKKLLYILVCGCLFIGSQLAAQDFGNALNFDGIDDRVVIPHFERPKTMTIEAWISISDNTSSIYDENYKMIVGWAGNGNSAEFFIADNVLAYCEYDGSTFPCVSSEALDVGKWYHVVLVRNDDLENNVKIYINGKLASQATAANSYTTTNTLMIGAYGWNGGGRYFNGSIDEVRIWNLERSYKQLNENLNKTLVGDEQGLLAYYNFDNGTPDENNSGITTLVDNSLNQNDGSLENFSLSGPLSNWTSSCARVKDDYDRVAYYSFTGNANDESGYCNDGTVYNATLTKDRFGNPNSAYHFNGNSAYIDLGNDKTSTIKDGFSISAWFNRTGPGTFQTIVGRGWREEGDYWLALYNNGSGYVLRFWVEGQVFNGTKIVPDGWNHVAFVAETGTNGVKLYLNGELYEQFTTSKDLQGSSAYNLRIGNDDRDEFYYFNGDLDDVTVYTKPLSIGEVRLLYGAVPLDFNIDEPSFGNALDFDGLNDFIDMPSDTLSEVYEGFTIESWVKWDGNPASPNNKNVIFEIIQGYGQVEGDIKFKVNGFQTGCNGHRPCSYWIDNSKTLDNLWHHLAVTVDVETGIGKFYVDGVVTGSINVNTCLTDGNCTNGGCNQPGDSDPAKLYGLVAKNRTGGGHRLANLFTIGRDAGGNYFDGRLDELRIWNYPRTATQIGAYRYVPLSSDEPGLVYYLDFNNGKPNQVNTGISKIKDARNKFEGELLGFSLNGNTSNWVKSNFNEDATNFPIISSITPTSSIAGQVATIYGANIYDNPNYYQVFFGDSEAEIASISSGVIRVVVPDGIKGLQPVRIINSFGTSNSLNFSIISGLSQLPFTWNKQTLYSQSQPTSIQKGDANNDGHMDIIFTSTTELVYLENNGLGKYPNATIITNGFSFQELLLFDVDGDGDLDIICTENSSTLVWYRNNDLAQSWTRIPLLSGQPYMALEPADMDRDGDIDLIIYGRLPELSNQHGIKIIYNNGNGAFSGASVVASGEEYFRPNGLVVDDFNGDGYFDFSIVVPSPDRIFTFHNNKNGGFIKTEIGTPAPYAEISSIGDINNDELPDIVNIGFQPSFNWWLNEDGINFNQTFTGIFTGGATSLDPGDLNGDGYIDFLAGFNFDKNQIGANVKWYKNKFGESQGFDINEISNEVYSVVDVKSLDIDNDGDLDILTASANDNRITAFYHVFSSNDFESFFLTEQVNDAIIDIVNHSIDITIKNNVNLAKLFPAFTVSEKAKLYYNGDIVESGLTSIDFSDPGNFAFFSIVAENGDAQDWVVTVHPLPETVVLNEATNITQNSADISWSIPTFVDSYFVEISSDNFNTFDLVEVNVNNTTISLVTGTSYKVRVKGKSSFGESESYSNIISFVTVPEIPTLTNVSEVSESSLVINWEATQNASQYKLDVAKDELFNSFVGGYQDRGVASLSESVIGLSTGTTYWARLRAANSSGVSPNSETLSFTTIPQVPSLINSTASQKSINLKWNSVTGADGYQIELITPTNTTILNYGNDTTLDNIENLIPATDYIFRIRAYNEAGYSNFSGNLVLTTIPETPTGIKLEVVSQTTASISWNELEGAQNYLVELSDNNFATNISGYNPKTADLTIENLFNLMPGRTYHMRLKSKNISGNSPYSEVFTFKTIPNTPAARDASSITSNSFNANWDRVDGDGVYYLLEVSNSISFQSITSRDTVRNALTKSITGLQNGVSYWYRVLAGNEFGASPYSNVIFVEQPLSINSLSFSESASKVSTSSIPLTFNVTGGSNDYIATFRYRGILSNVFTELPITGADNSFSFDIISNLLDEIGIEFEILVSDGNKSVSSGNKFIYWSDIEQEIPFANQAGQWQLFSIPYKLDDNLIETVFDEMGPFKYKNQWRLMHYDGTKYVDAGGGINKIDLGLGYWFNSTEQVNINIGTGSVNTDTPFPMSLRQGWNQIGNPYNVPISWNSIRQSNGVTGTVDPVILYNPSNSQFVNGDEIEPFEGGFVWADEAKIVEISLVNNKSGSRVDDSDITNNNIDDIEWIFGLKLSANGMQHELASIGMHPEAHIDKDKYDKVVLPRFINYLEMYTRHEDYFYPWFSTDIVPSTDKQSWLFTMESNFIGGGAVINWDNTDIMNSKSSLWLIDEEEGTIIDMKSTDNYRTNINGSHRFSIHYNTTGDQPIPYLMQMTSPFPNPSNGLSTVRISLPEHESSYNINLQVLDLKGNLIKEVINGTVEPGVHEFTTDFNTNGQIHNGVYFYRLILDNTSSPIYKKLVLTK